MKSDGSLWQGFASGLGQTIPIVLVTGIGALVTMTMNMQIQLAELRKDQQRLMSVIEERHGQILQLQDDYKDVVRRVTILETTIGR